MAYQCRFNLILMGYLDANDVPGESNMIVEDMEIPFLFYKRKVYQHIRKPMEEELENLLEVKITAPIPYNPSSNTYLQSKHKNIKKARFKIPIKE